MNFLQRLILKGIPLPSYSEKAGKGISQPFTTNAFGKYNLAYEALAKKDYILEYRNWPYACVSARAESMGNIKLRLMNKSTGEEVDSHPFLDLLESPNPFETRYDLFYGTSAYKDLDGNSFWYLAKDGSGTIRQIYNLKSDKVKIVQSEENPLAVQGYMYTQPDGTRIPFEADEIWHQRMFNPNAPHPFPHRGMGIIQASAYAIDTDNESRKWNLAFFRNCARPDGVLYSQGEGVMRPEEFKRQSEEWEERHQGSDNMGKTALLSGGMKWEAVTSTHTEMDFYEQRQFGRDEILAMFKVPKTVIGIADDVNRANADAAIYVYNLLTIKPLMQRMVDGLNRFLLPMIDNSGKYYLDFHSPISEDREQLLEEYEVGVNTWLTVNEIREREGLPTMEGGDSLYIPFSDTDISQPRDTTDETVPPQKSVKEISKLKTPKKEKTKKASAKKAEKTDVEKTVEKFIAQLPKVEKTVRLGKEVKEKYITEYKAKSLIRVNGLKKSLKKYFVDQEKEVLANLKDEMKGLEPIEYKLKGISDIIFDEDNAVQVGINLITPFIKDYIKTAGISAITLAGGTDFNSTSDFLKTWTKDRAEYFASTITTTTQDELKTALKAGIDNSESLPQISKRVAEVYDKARDYRTDMIARTEVSAASNVGAIEAYKQAGVTQQEWVVVDPEDEDCITNEGIVVDIGDSFPSGDDKPPVHPNCQCTTIPVFDDKDTDENDQ